MGKFNCWEELGACWMLMEVLSKLSICLSSMKIQLDTEFFRRHIFCSSEVRAAGAGGQEQL